MDVPNAFDRSALFLDEQRLTRGSYPQAPSYEGADGTIALADRSWGTLIGLDVAPWWYLATGLCADVASDCANQVQALRRASIARHQAIGRSVGGYSKRALDICVATVALTLLAPIMVLIALVLWAQYGRPMIIAHPRVGFEGRVFKCLKFRSMVVDADAVLALHLTRNPQAAQEWRQTQKLRDDPRVTRIGRFLRLTSLDELPQLFNVLAGEMSCVGPRPVVQAELRRYGRHARYYLKSRPGLTGIWQVNGRSSTTYSRRVAMDTYYVRHWSLLRDTWLLLMTIPALIKTGDAA